MLLKTLPNRWGMRWVVWLLFTSPVSLANCAIWLQMNQTFFLKKENNRQRLINKDRKFRVFSCDWLCNTAGTAANPGKNWKHNLLVQAIFYGSGQVVCVFLFFSKKWQHAKSITRNNNNNHFSSLKAVHHIYLELQNNLFNRSQVNIFLTSKMYKLAKKSTEYRFVSVFQWKPCRFSWRPESLLPLRGEKQFKWPPETSPKPVVIHFIKTWMKSMPGCERGITDGKKVGADREVSWVSGWSSWSTSYGSCRRQTSGHEWIET